MARPGLTRAEIENIYSNPDRAIALRDMMKAFPNPSNHSFNAIMAKADDDDGDRDDGGGGITNHPVVQLARLLVASGKFGDHAQALDHLLNTSHGQALIARMHKAAEQPAKESPMDTVYSIMKDGSISGVCAAIIQKGETSFSEHELVEAATKIAAERHPELSESQAFSKVYTAATDEARVLQKAIAIAKLSPFDIAPTMVGSPDAMHEAVNNTEQSEAYRQLEALAEKMRAAHPELSAAKAFAAVFTDKRNAAVAERAHRRPSATTSFPHPR